MQLQTCIQMKWEQLLYNIRFRGFDGSVNIESHTTDPADIHVSFPKNILANSNTLATVQIIRFSCKSSIC